MNQEVFAIALRNLNQADEQSILQRLRDMFLGITQMDADNVVAAAQTVRTTAHLLGKLEDPILVHLLQATQTQMKHLHHLAIASGGAIDYTGMRRRFSSALGDPQAVSDHHLIKRIPDIGNPR